LIIQYCTLLVLASDTFALEGLMYSCAFVLTRTASKFS